MPTERIRITPQEFKTTNADGQTTFSTNNKYFKTTSTGAFKVGGFERAPFVAGFEYSQDKTWLGGYLQRGVITNTDKLEITVPFTNASINYVDILNKVNDAFSPGYGTGIMAKQKRYAINITNGGGTPYYLAIWYGAYPGSPTYKFPWGLTSVYVPGTYVFDGSPLGNAYDQMSPVAPWVSNSPYVGPYDPSNLNNVSWDPGMSYLFTQPTQNIDLAVTI